MATLDTAHRCPGCGAGHAERRTPRTLMERAAVSLTGHRPYRCLDCGRRFYDRPMPREGGTGSRRRSRPPAATPAPAVRHAGPAPTIEITTGEAQGPRRRRRPRWVIDPGNTPLARIEVYVLVALGVLLLVTIAIALRWLWPEPTGGVRLFD